MSHAVEPMLLDLIRYFVQRTGGYLTKIQLVKFIYLADLYAVKWTGKQITKLEWIFYHHGPWSQDIQAAIDELEGAEIETTVHFSKKYGKDAFLLGVGPSAAPPEHLDIGLELMLENIRREWAGFDEDKIDQLLKYVYEETQPMRVAREGHTPADRARLNLMLEHEAIIKELGLNQSAIQQ